jgi:hypothetical protein
MGPRLFSRGKWPGSNAIGYTSLAFSRDGVAWHRCHEPFLDRNHQAGAWDHAMTWGSAVLHVGEELLIYYGGYARGHEVAAGTERQLGLARMKRDRYVALVPTGEQGKLLTKPFVLPDARMAVNLKAAKGQVVLRMLDSAGKALDDVPSQTLSGDSVAARVTWPSRLHGKPVRLEATLVNAAMFALEFA